MRKCTIHGTELNCAANVIGGQCGGILYGTDASAEMDAARLASDAVDHAHDEAEASERLGDFAEVIEDATEQHEDKATDNG